MGTEKSLATQKRLRDDATKIHKNVLGGFCEYNVFEKQEL